jgi:uncharacterized protein YkwD
MKISWTWIRLMIALAALLAAAGRARSNEAPAVANYGQEVQVRIKDDEQAALDALIELVKGYGGEPLRHDPRLTLVARDLAAEIQNDLTRQTQILSSPRAVELKHRYGVYEGSTRMRSFPINADMDLRALIRSQYGPGQVDSTHVGVGTVAEDGQGRSGVLVVILSNRLAELAPFPRQAHYPSSYTLRGRLVNKAADWAPSVMMTYPDGKIRKLDVSANGPAFSASIAFDHGEGTYRVEVVARGNGNVEMAALMTVPAGAAGGSGMFAVAGFDREPANEAQAEQMVLDMINQVRDHEGLSRVSTDGRLQDMAQGYSREMRKYGFVGHRSPASGALEDRRQAAGLQGVLILENVAQNSSLAGAMNSLLESPAHRAAIVDPRMTRVGVGVAFDDASGVRHYYLAQEFGQMD